MHVRTFTLRDDDRRTIAIFYEGEAGFDNAVILVFAYGGSVGELVLAREPKYEGHWKDEPTELSDLPWPHANPEWNGRVAFIARLGRVESISTAIEYRGVSRCRVCGAQNGHRAFRLEEWEWPEGFAHYIRDHDARPSVEFEKFIARHDGGNL